MSAAAKMGLFGGAGEKHITHNCKWMMCDFYFNKSTMVRSNLSVPIQQVFLTKGHGHPLFCRIHEHLAVLITCFSPSRPIRQPSMGLPGNTSFSFSASAISSYCIHPPPPPPPHTQFNATTKLVVILRELQMLPKCKNTLPHCGRGRGSQQRPI